MTEVLSAYDGSGLYIGRKVVRCVDCGNAEPLPVCDLPWLPGEAATQTTGYLKCYHFTTPGEGWQSTPWIVEADGFCSWGIEKGD